MIIGITGTFGAGKDTIAQYLTKKKGFGSIGLGDIVREFVKKLHWPNTRDSQREMGNYLRDKYGADFLIKEAIKRIPDKNKVIPGIRQSVEADYLKHDGGAFLVAVDAPIKKRFYRISLRNRPGDPKSLKELQEKEQKEMFSDPKNPNCQNISYCMKVADFHLDNSGTKKMLYQEIEAILQKTTHR